jgi:hypothetical protein
MKEYPEAGLEILSKFFMNTESYMDYIFDLIRVLIPFIVSDNKEIVRHNMNILNIILQRFDKVFSLNLLKTIYLEISTIIQKTQKDLVPGFCLDNALDPYIRLV